MKSYNAQQIKRTMAKYSVGEVAIDLVPGVCLQMAEVTDAYTILEKMAEQEAKNRRVERFPYWAEIWPTSLALARWFVEGRLPGPGGWACELGCGLGLVGIALAKAGWCVEATDFVEDALILTTYNARLNKVGARHRVGYLDWRNPVGAQKECLVASDVIYEKKNHPYLERVLRELLAPGGFFFLGDPQRKAAAAFVALLQQRGYGHQVETRQETWKGVEQLVDIHVFTKP